jgi:alpha-methylacyl-CoA racemase
MVVKASGPLRGTQVIEVGSTGPATFTAMVLADMGAEVIRLARPSGGVDDLLAPGSLDVLLRGRHAVTVDLRQPDAAEFILTLCELADALLEGFRPGVMERLALGPEQAQARNPRLVYGRMTGYGQDGPHAQRAGHDLNYIAVAGALGACARRGERPMFPLNLLGDFGGGGMLLAVGVLAALLEARISGRGQVVDAAMVDGVALLSTLIYGLRAAGMWSDEPGTNLLDSGAPFYDLYETADGSYVAVAAIEPEFYSQLLRLLDIGEADAPQWDRAAWPTAKDRFAAAIHTRTSAEWIALCGDSDACMTPVPKPADAPQHPHNQARGVFIELNGVIQPAPAPRFSRTPSTAAPSELDSHTAWTALASWGISRTQLERHRTALPGLRKSSALKNP